MWPQRSERAPQGSHAGAKGFSISRNQVSEAVRQEDPSRRNSISQCPVAGWSVGHSGRRGVARPERGEGRRGRWGLSVKDALSFI